MLFCRAVAFAPAEQVIDEPTVQSLCDYIRRMQPGTTENELAAFRANLLHCVREPAKHQFSLQLRDGLCHRSKKQLELEWGTRKQVRYVAFTCFAPQKAKESKVSMCT